MLKPQARAEEKSFFDQRGFGQHIGFGEKPAILVVDFMKAFTNPDMPLGSKLDAEIEHAGRLLDIAHERGVPVFFSAIAYDEDGLKDAGIWSLKQKGIVTLQAGTPGVELDNRLHRASTDVVFQKKYASCFFATDLASRLQFRRIDTLVIVGCTTSGCVRATVVDACQSGFRPIVVREAVGDRSQLAHDQSLSDIDAKYGDVLSMDEVVAQLTKPLRNRPATPSG
jgi:nicotinamidase-related amidase